MTIEKQLLLHEGLRLHVYDDATGKQVTPGTTLIGHPTIGIGRNLNVGITEEEALYLLRHDIETAQQDLEQTFPWFYDLSLIRRNVLIDMTFNMGIGRLKRFKRMLAAIEAHDWERAAQEMLNSKWATQVGARARRLAQQMREG